MDYNSFKAAYLAEQQKMTEQQMLEEGFLKDKIAPLAVAGALSLGVTNADAKAPTQEQLNNMSSWVKEVMLVSNLPKDQYRDIVLTLQNDPIASQDISKGKTQKNAIKILMKKFKESGDLDSLKKLQNLDNDFFK